MGTFNVLKIQNICSICSIRSEIRIQFSFGDTWQFEYEIGDTIRWGGYDIGKPNLPKVKVYGILETEKCFNCNSPYIIDEFDILVQFDVIMEVQKMANFSDYLVNDGDYVELSP